MKLTIIASILNSHEIVKRQIRHLRRLRLSNDIEIIFVDDGSDPPLDFSNMGLPNFTMFSTGCTRPWSEGIAKNTAAEMANGEIILLFDIDHIIPKNAIRAAYNLKVDKMRFGRRFGILSKQGKIITDKDSLLAFGLSHERFLKKGMRVPSHGNTFAIRKSVFLEMGGYDKKRSSLGRQGWIDKNFNNRWTHAVNAGIYRPEVYGPIIYVYPTGRFHETGDQNPWGLFHNLPRDNP